MSNSVSVKSVNIDGREVPLNGERNLLEVIRKAGIDLPTDGELATTRLANAQRDVAYITAGVVKPEEVAVELQLSDKEV